MTAAVEKFSVAGPAGELEGVAHLTEQPPRAVAIVAHPLSTMGGTMENKVVTTLAKTFAELGFAALRFNFRSVGTSAGAFDNGNGETEDVLAIAKYALDAFGGLPLILSGFSFGGYVQLRAAQQLHPQHLVLVAPAIVRFAPLAADFSHMAHRTLLIHGEQDEIIPLADVLEWARPQELPVTVLPGAEHFFHGRLHQIRQVVLREFNGLPL